MCGIAGIISNTTSIDDRETLIQRALPLLKHRGPDGHGIYSQGNSSFGHTRLSILDLEGGGQPFLDPTTGNFITYNGEVYNYLELKKELESKEHQFKSTSDTEVVLKAYQEWGLDFLGRLNGMFAFALYDSKNQLTILARDPFGQKPLYYYHSNGEFCFSSELSALKMIAPIRADVDRNTAIQFLITESWPGEETFYHGIKKLLPGHFLQVKDRKIELKSYFEIQSQAEIVPSQKEIELAIYSAVQKCLRSDVPTSILLSGGLDSSLVLANVCRLQNSSSIDTFTIKNADPTFDESEIAKQTSQHFGTKHNEIELTYSDMCQIALDVLPFLDEPIADPGFLPKYHICRYVSKTHKVALTGDGGDEVFFGYEIFKAFQIARKLRWVPQFINRDLLLPVSNMIKPGHGYMSNGFKVKRFLRGLASPSYLRNIAWAGAYQFEELPQVLLKTDQHQVPISQIQGLYQKIFQNEKNPETLTAFSHLYQQTFLPEYVLRNSDRASMLLGVELRAPFLDLELFSLAQALPENLKLNGLITKQVLRNIGSATLPSFLLKQKKKGFTSPVGALLKGQLKSDFIETFSEKNCQRTELFNREFILSQFEKHLSGGDNLYKLLWTNYTLQKWLLQRT